MSSLKNIQLTFGDNAMSSKVLTSSQIEKIVKTIQRSDINTVYNGYVTCDTAISASNAFMLERNGIIYTGSIIPDEYTISASKTTIAEGDEIIFESTGVAVQFKNSLFEEHSFETVLTPILSTLQPYLCHFNLQKKYQEFQLQIF